MIEIKDCLVVDGRFYTTGDIVEFVTDDGVECNFLERYVGRIEAINKNTLRTSPYITLDIGEQYHAETINIPVKCIKDVLIHAPSLMQSEPQSDSTEKKHGKPLFRLFNKN